MSLSALTSQKKVTQVMLRKIGNIVDHISKEFELEAVYLIGSVHRGIIHKYSDVDLIAVVPDANKQRDLSSKVLPTRPHQEIPLDLHFYRLKEFEKMKNIGGLCFEAFHHGTLWKRNSQK